MSRAPSTPAIEALTPKAAASALAAGALYLDVRTPEEFEEGHAEGAWNLPIALRAAGGGLEDNPEFLPLARALLATDRQLLIGCRSGPRAERAAARLREAGYLRLHTVEGGMEGRRDAFGALEVKGWKQYDLPLAFDLAESYAVLRARAVIDGERRPG